MDIYTIIIQKVINTIPVIYDFAKLPLSNQVTNVLINAPINGPINGPINPLTSVQFTNRIGTDSNRIQAWHTIFTNEIIDSSINTILKIIFYMYIDSYYQNHYIILKKGGIIPLSNTKPNLSKFQLLNQVFENPFYNESTKDAFLLTVCKIQRTYFAMIKLVKIIKHRRSALYNTTDIVMNPINRRHANNIEIYQNNKVYLFTRPDIINLFNAALSHSPSFFSDPLPIKNPYNNMFFRKSDLYNMYFFLRSGLFIVSDLIQSFFLGNFDLKKFQDENEYIIRDYSIKSYVENTPITTLHSEIKRMIYTAALSHKICIHAEFPKDKLVKIMKPYLLLYFQSLFSIDAYKREDCMDILIRKLIRFHMFNPLFGRQNIKRKQIFIPTIHLNNCKMKFSKMKFKKIPYKRIVCFHDEHVPFLVKDANFMTSHV